jgi:hypothetical protein
MVKIGYFATFLTYIVSWCQFHQHSTSIFIVIRNFSSVLVKRPRQKTACKMLVKLTTVRLGFLQHRSELCLNFV